MERVFCENCGRERRAVEAVGAYEGTPYCEPCKKLDEIPEQDFVRFGVQGVASDAGSRSQVATPEAAARPGGGDTPESLKTQPERKCDQPHCHVKLRNREGKSYTTCAACRQGLAAKKARITVADTIEMQRRKFPTTAEELNLPEILKNSTNRKLVRKIIGEPKAALALLSDDDYQQLKPNTGDRDLFQKLLATVGDRKNHPCRVKLDYARRDLKNFANRVRRVLRLNNKQDALVETFPTAKCVVVSVGYGKQAK